MTRNGGLPQAGRCSCQSSIPDGRQIYRIGRRTSYWIALEQLYCGILLVLRIGTWEDMDEEQRHLRYVLPGFTVPLIFVVTVFLARPDLLASMFRLSTQSVGAGLVSALGTLLASGLFGFFSAQIYFACWWWSLPNYKTLFKDRNCPVSLLAECGEKWNDAKGRRGAQHLARYIWQTRVAPFEENLNRHVGLQATRKASVGSAAAGIVGGLLSAILLCLSSPRISLVLVCRSPAWSVAAYPAQPTSLSVWRLVVWAAILILTFICLCCLHCSFIRFLEFAVPAGVKPRVRWPSPSDKAPHEARPDRDANR